MSDPVNHIELYSIMNSGRRLIKGHDDYVLASDHAACVGRLTDRVRELEAALRGCTCPPSDACIQCGVSLPPLCEWSMPACPSCVDKAFQAQREAK
jgi:hypothetical protein